MTSEELLQDTMKAQKEAVLFVQSCKTKGICLSAIAFAIQNTLGAVTRELMEENRKQIL